MSEGDALAPAPSREAAPLSPTRSSPFPKARPAPLPTARSWRADAEILRRFRVAMSDGGDGRVVLCRLQLGPEAASMIEDEMERAGQKLVWLELSHNALGDAGAECIARGMGYCPNLRGLGLEENRIGVAGRNAVARAMRRCPTLTTLNMKRNNLRRATAPSTRRAATAPAATTTPPPRPTVARNLPARREPHVWRLFSRPFNRRPTAAAIPSR